MKTFGLAQESITRKIDIVKLAGEGGLAEMCDKTVEIAVV